MIRKRYLIGIVVFLFAAGCASPAANNPTAVMSETTPTQEAMMESSPTAEVMLATATPEAMMNEATSTESSMMMEGTATPQAMTTEAMPNTGEMTGSATPMVMGTAEGMMPEGTPTGIMTSNEWLSTPLTDVSTGKSFMLSDFHGKTVLVELISTQCAACLQQQKSIQAYLAGKMADITVVSLDIVPNETSANLKDHLGMNNFSWTFANAPSNLVTQIGQDFGSQYVDPTHAPLLVIDSMGAVHALPLNLTTQNEIQTALANYMH